jgi:hypothetical protein
MSQKLQKCAAIAGMMGTIIGLLALFRDVTDFQVQTDLPKIKSVFLPVEGDTALSKPLLALINRDNFLPLKPFEYVYISNTGAIACPLKVGQQVVAREGTNLWTAPDVITGSNQEPLPLRSTLNIISTPSWGRIRQESEQQGWWFQVQSPDGSRSGYVWEARLENCPSPESFKVP